MAISNMPQGNNGNFCDWMVKQMRQAGEELIRRSEQMNFEGWDLMRSISISIDIPTYTDLVEAPEIEISFTMLNKVMIDDYIREIEGERKAGNES